MSAGVDRPRLPSILIDVAQAAELFMRPMEISTSMTTAEIWPICSKGFRRWLPLASLSFPDRQAFFPIRTLRFLAVQSPRRKERRAVQG
jgi:hypothetical protein